MKYIIMILITMFVLAGCASTPPEDRGRVAVQYTVLKLVEQSDEIDGDRVLAAVERIRIGIGEDELVRPEDLTGLVMGRLDLSELSSADQFLVQSVVDQVARGLLDQVDDGVLPDDYQARLSVWLDWIEEAAYMAGAE